MPDPLPSPRAAGFDDHKLLGWLRRAVDEHAILAITDAQGVIVYANDQFCRISGYAREELLGRTHRVVRSDEHPPEFFAEMWRTINAGQTWHGTICNRNKAGEPYWVESTIVPLPGPDGRPHFHLALRTDVTKLKRAESERAAAESDARQMHEQLRVFYEHAPIGISWLEWGRDGAGNILHPNRRFCEILGLTPEEARDFNNVRRATHPDDLAEQDALITALWRGEGDSFTMEKRYRHRLGHLVWCRMTIAVLRGADRRITHQFAMIEDITERKQAEAVLRDTLRRSEELEHIVNRSPSVAVLWRAAPGWPAEFVSAGIRQFGYAPEDFISRRFSFHGITHPEDRARVRAEMEAHAAARHGEYAQEYRLVCADGSVRWVDDHTVVRHDAQGQVTHHEALITDITARKQAEARERERQEHDLRLAGDVQHHLRPHALPDIGEVEIAALAQPAAHIGGDYYDVLPVGARRWGLVIADVAGHGPAAALMMAACRATLRQCADGETSAAAVVRRVNRALHGDMPPGMFITMFYGILDFETNRLRYARAGHEPALLLRAGAAARTELLRVGGLALGLDAGPVFDATLEEGEAELGPGDLLALHTDGITEAADAQGTEFGRDRLVAALRAYGDRPLADLPGELEAALDTFAAAGARPDDRTLLLARLR
jgi:sigma-B regulation protein RsbU (phosphoserine phosphatase)